MRSVHADGVLGAIRVYAAAIGSPKRLDGCQGQHRMASQFSRRGAGEPQENALWFFFHVSVAGGLRRKDVGTLPLDLAACKTLASRRPLKTSTVP